jgi:hypothetical protein
MSQRKPPLSDTFLWATFSLAHQFKIEAPTDRKSRWSPYRKNFSSLISKR